MGDKVLVRLKEKSDLNGARLTRVVLYSYYKNLQNQYTEAAVRRCSSK